MMNYRIRIFTKLLILLPLLALLCGCTAAEPTFNGTNVSQATSASVDVLETAPPTDKAAVTTEIAESASTAEAVTEPSPTLPETTAEAESESAQPHRIAVPRLSGQTRADAEKILQDAGIPYTVSEIYSTQYPKGSVVKLQFYGTLDEESCYINPAYPTEVIVSLGGRWKTNVTAVDEKRIYLTFDDGPHHNTDRVLEILEEYGAKATFFTLGTYIAVYPERTKAICDSGHLLACHSYSHDYMKLYESAESTLTEIRAWEDAVEAAGVSLPQTVYFRFPGGSTTDYMARDRYEEIFWAITDAGYYAMDWTCANNDRYLNGKTEEQTLVEYLVESTAVTLNSLSWTPTTPKIMLMHDTADETVEALPQILEYLIGEGYTFGTLDELDGYWVFQ